MNKPDSTSVKPSRSRGRGRYSDPEAPRPREGITGRDHGAGEEGFAEASAVFVPEEALTGTGEASAGPAASPGLSIADGIAVLQRALPTLPQGPGVYRMIDADDSVLYVGKARNLRKRVTSYTALSRLGSRLARMVASTARLEVVSTHTEVEALLLESNLIKRLAPRYNVLLRDDKSFPNILITGGHPFARIVKHRGARTADGTYFGPFASAGAVNRTITALQRAFLLRNCSDAVFASRTRPCLQYQIKRCAAPCVGRIDEAGYRALVDDAAAFLSGKSRDVQAGLARAMQAASDTLEFETAAIYRNRIRALTSIQQHQDINVAGLEDADVIAAHSTGGQVCVQVFFFRGGQNFGNKAYFPSHDRGLEVADVLAGFLGQFYETRPPPPLVLVSEEPSERALIEQALSVRADRRVELVVPKRGVKREVIDQAVLNAREALARRQADSASQRALLTQLVERLDLDGVPERIEVYDNSHIQGRDAIGAMIVSGPEGLMKSAYRKFTIKNPETEPGDDFAMMREVLTRRFSRALKEDPDRSAGQWPDLVLIDGGQGQLSATLQVLADLGIDDLAVVAIAKGPDRNAGRERLFRAGEPPLSLDPRDPVLFFLQRLRDEAHRFAIGTHRAKRAKNVTKSAVDDIPGIGPKRKKALLHHFGSGRAVARAGLADLQAVEGISEAVATRIYQYFHGDG